MNPIFLIFVKIKLSFSSIQSNFLISSTVYSLELLSGSRVVFFLFSLSISFLIISFLWLIVSTSKVELKYRSTNLFSCTFSFSMAFSISFTSLLAQIMGSSHQNVKQILFKLEKKGFVYITVDENDRRKQRIELTDYCRDFCSKNDEMTTDIMKEMFAGVTEEQLQVTIQTIIKIEDNLKEISEYE